jgi:hypothetical protein
MPNHHEHPKHYLKGFSELGTSFVWVFRRNCPYMPGLKAGKNNPAKLGLNRVGLRADGYAAPDPNGRWDYRRYEAKLQKIEYNATPTIDKLRVGEEIDLEGKALLAKYILTMLKRRTSRDQRMRPELQKATSIVVAAARNQAKRAAFSGDFAQAVQLESRARFWQLRGDVLFARESMVKDAGLATAALLKPLWEFAKAAPGSYFVTTDNPVGSENLYMDLTFPISRDILITYALKGNDLTYRQATSEETRRLNSCLILRAENEIYSPQPDRWIYEGWKDGVELGGAGGGVIGH